MSGYQRAQWRQNALQEIFEQVKKLISIFRHKSEYTEKHNN